MRAAAEPESKRGQCIRVSKAAAALPRRAPDVAPSNTWATDSVIPCCSVGPPMTTRSVLSMLPAEASSAGTT
jgi:hypothetical protein